MSERDRLTEREFIMAELNRLERKMQEQIAELRDELYASEKRANKYAEILLEAHAKVSAAYPVPQSLRA